MVRADSRPAAVIISFLGSDPETLSKQRLNPVGVFCVVKAVHRLRGAALLFLSRMMPALLSHRLCVVFWVCRIIRRISANQACMNYSGRIKLEIMDLVF